MGCSLFFDLFPTKNIAMLIQCEILKKLINESSEKEHIKSILNGMVDAIVEDYNANDRLLKILENQGLKYPNIVFSTDELIVFTVAWDKKSTVFGFTFKNEHGNWIRVNQVADTFDEIILLYIQYKLLRVHNFTLIDLFSKHLNINKDEKTTKIR